MKKLLAIVFALCVSLASAFDGKQQPIKFVVPFAPGGGTDLAIKIYEKYINEMGYKTLIDYKPGADGLVGKRDFLEKNDLSGYSILINGSVAMAHEDTFAQDKGWKADDFAMVADIIHVPNALVASKKSEIIDFKTFQSKIRNGEKLNFAYGALPGKFSSMILIDNVKSQDNQVLLVPYKGAAPALNNVVGGHADLVLVPVSMAMGLYETNRVNVLFVGGSQRFAKMNSVPTAAEINMPMPYVGSWGAVLPKNISKDIVDFYVSLFKKIASDPRFVNDINGIESFAQSDKMGPADMRESYNKHLKLFEKYKNIN